MTDFSKTLIRCSAIGKIMTEPKEKAAKDAGELSKTAKSYLKELYIQEKWGISKDIQNKFTDKGKMVEEDSLTMLALLDKKYYLKNEERLTNDYLTGEPDIFDGDDVRNARYIIDAKSSWDAWTFIGKLGEPIDKDYWWQLQGYFALTNANEGEVSYCLISTPQQIIEDEKKRLFYKMNVATEENADYEAACDELENAMTFDHIPLHLRRIRFPVKRDDLAIQSIYDKVEKCRVYLQEIEKMHIGK